MSRSIKPQKTKMEVVAEEIVKILKGYRIAEANIALDNARSLINWKTKIK